MVSNKKLNMPVLNYMKRILTSSNLIRVFAVWGAISTLFLFVVAVFFMSPNSRAVMFMATGLVILWVVLGGFLIWKTRELVRALVQQIPLPWSVKFVLFCSLLALTEEAVTVTMTNLVPVLGVAHGAAYITASANYLDVVAFHSVVVFIPMFIAWAWMLKRWDVSPNAVFLLFGLTGFFVEAIFSGTLNLVPLGFWIFVYGLMIYLPAYCLPPREEAKLPVWWHYPVMLILPVLSATPVATVNSHYHPYPIHFPPIPPDS
jgi:hypothetical protein